MKTTGFARFTRRSRVIAALAVTGLVVGTTAASAGSIVEPAALAFHAINPVRVLDTRTGTGGSHVPLSAGGVLALSIPGLPGDAAAVTVNVIAVGGTKPSYLLLYGEGDPVPATSTLNWSDSRAVADGTVVKLSADHMIDIRNHVGTVDVVVDVIGYYSPSSAVGTGPAGPVGPAGATGPTGPVGATGAKGADGADGATGPVGPVGAAGAAGAKGADGATGPRGLPGLTGLSGPPGSKGLPGPGGPPGSKGDTGDTGPAGATGSKGDTGDTGPAGAAGVNGAKGADGKDGAPGIPGPTGPPGSPGVPGPPGVKGDKGDKGDPGAPGPAGTGGGGGGAILMSSAPASISTTTSGASGNVTAVTISGNNRFSMASTGATVDASTIGSIVEVFPRAGTITSIAAHFIVVGDLSVNGVVTLTAQLYTSASGGNTLTAVQGVSCTLGPTLTGAVSAGTVSSCTSSGLNVPVTSQTVGIILISAKSSGTSSANNMISGSVATSLSVS